MSDCNKAFKSCPVYDPVSVAMTVCVAQQMLFNGSTQSNRSALFFNVTKELQWGSA